MEQMLYREGHRPASAEQKSWRASLPVLAADLLHAGLGDVEILVEYHLPLTSKRADVVLAGVHPDTGGLSYVVVELKQWSAARRWEGSPTLVEVPGAAGPRLHPALQVRGYCDHMTDFLRILEHQPDAIAGAAYLHNATTPDETADLYPFDMSVTSSLFTGANRGAFHHFLRSRLATRRSGARAADELLSSAVSPSKQLLKVAADEVQHREQFVLLDGQRIAYELVLHQVEAARRADSKRVIVVTGGPGSGKSVIALSVLGELARRGRTVVHATGSRSFTKTLRKVAGHRAPRVQKLFTYFNSFMTAERNGLDVLIMDEAHRIRQTSVNRYTRAAQRTDRPQIDELVSAARVPVFLLDGNQIVKPGEMGSVQQIEEYAEQRGLETVVIPLDGQFRCGGSAEYVTWVERLLGLRPGGDIEWTGDPAFPVLVAESPDQMETMLRDRMADGFSARMAAGYCWKWSDPTPDGGLVPDVTIGPWRRPWNVKGDRAIGSAPPSALWATSDGGFAQVGCVYTAQGFEYDWAGVIIGPDLVWRDGRLVTVRGENKDPAFRSRTQVDDQQFDRLVRNLYKVLLTRGMVGTIVYATDERTREQLRRLLSPPTP